MARYQRHIVVIGASAGGLHAVDALLGQFSAPLTAPMFLVLHMAPDNTGEAVLSRLAKHQVFTCKFAQNGERFKPGTVYIAPPDHHLLVKKSTMLVTKGARENRYRPAIDPLFRSAAVEHGPHVIGVVLTGLLDDGTAGLIAIKKCGGVSVIQDPKDAEYPAMPQSALDNVEIDHRVTLAGIGNVIEHLVGMPVGGRKAVPKDIRVEAAIAERVLSDVAQVNRLGTPVPYNCPNCGGVLWEMEAPDQIRYRCHTGHSYTASALLVSQSEKIEETLWVSLRMLEERKNLMTSMGEKELRSALKKSYAQRVKEMEGHIGRIKEMLSARYQ